MGKLKKILTMEDLMKFCSSSGIGKFNSKDCGYQLSVQIPAAFEEEKAEESDTLLYAFVRLFHIGLNRNGSSVTREAAEKSMSGIKYKPVLANFTTNTKDGNEDFTSHDMEIDDDGNITYIEKQVGCFTADDPYIAKDEETDKDFVYAKIAIPREYTSAADIIERKNGTKISVELLINDMSFNAKEKCLELNDIIVQGATLLGTNPETGEQVEEGMKNARVSLEDFSVQNNSMFTHTEINEKLIETLDKLNTTLSNFNKDDDNHQFEQKGGQEDMGKFEELLEKYGKTAEDIDFEYEGMSDEELEAKFAEMFDEGDDASSDGADDGDSDTQADEGDSNTDVSGGGSGTDPSEGQGTGSTTPSEPKEDEDEDEEEVQVPSDDEETKKKKYSFTSGDKTYAFELSLNDKVGALSDLVNATYAEADNTWYGITAYESYVVMNDWWNGKYFKQSYKQDGDTFSLIGDREEVFVNFLTKDEEAVLAEMKANYSAIESELNAYKEAESNTQKDAIFATDYYQEFLETKEFKSLMEEKDKYSVEELKDKAELAFAKCVREKGTFSVKENTKQTFRKMVGSPKKDIKKNPYGTILKDKD